ncbi:MAG: hypothetical protein P4N24_08220 [Acidobacteriota bacterium]|nr:hypothetical protein [Acidobacteriota bacterium]
MRIKRTGLTSLILFTVCATTPLVPFAYGQEPATISLGDLARQLSVQRAKNAPNSSHVITNDDFQSHPIGPSSAPQQDATKPGDEKTADKGKRAHSAGQQAESGHGEQYFRTRMFELRRTLELDQDALRKVDQRLAEKGCILDIYCGLNPPFRKVYNPNDPEVDWTPVITILPLHYSLRQRVADEQKTILDLEGQCRREGCEPEWLR